MERYRDIRVVGVDMPLGLVDKGAREADQAARAFLKGQAPSVFPAPPRPVLAAKSYDDAKVLAKRINGKSVSKQVFAILPKIRELDAFAAHERIHEVHPEVSFRLMNDGVRIEHRKTTWGGLQARLGLLRSHGIELPNDLGEANGVGIDDVVDAAAAAWSARRIAAGDATSFPNEPTDRDQCGRLILIRG